MGTPEDVATEKYFTPPDIKGGKMNLDKAIEILTYSSEQNTMLITGDEKDALKLGIEALKLVKASRQRKVPLHFMLLPGETE